MWSVTFNITKGCLGVGVLTMPWATQNVGIIPAAIILFLSFAASFLGWLFLCYVSHTLDVYEYRQLGQVLYGSKFALAIDLSLLFFLLLVCILYVIFIGDFICIGLREFNLNMDDGNGFDILYSSSVEDIICSKLFIVTLWVFLILFPLSLLRKLDSLKYSSLLGILATFYVVFIAVYNFYLHYDQILNVANHDLLFDNHKNGIQWFNFHANHNAEISGVFILFWLESFAIFSAAFNTHFNAPPLYGELMNRSPMRMFGIASASFAIVLVVNFIIAYAFYFMLAAKDSVITQNVLDSVFGNTISIARLVMVFAMSGSYPLLFWNVKISLKHMIFYDSGTHDIPPQPRKYTSQTSEWICYFFVTCFIWFVSVVYSQVGVLLGLIQSLLGNPITFIIPPLLFLKVMKFKEYQKQSGIQIKKKNKHSILKVICWIVIIFGIFASVGGTISAVLMMAGVL